MHEPFPLEDARQGHLQPVVEWQQAGGNVDAPFRFEDWTALQLLSAEGNCEGVQALLTAGATVDAHVEPVTPGVPWHSALHLASRFGHPEVVSVLADAGADLDLRDGHGFTPLHFAAAHGHLRTTERLLALGAQALPTRDAKLTPQALALAAGHRQVAAMLTQRRNSAAEADHEQLRGWLDSLGCGQYCARFLDAGYDFEFIMEHGLGEDDIDLIQVPKTKLGLRKKLLTLHNLPKSRSDRESSESGSEIGSETGSGDEGSGTDDASGSGESSGSGSGSDEGSDASSDA